jgi:hypothetical protein
VEVSGEEALSAAEVEARTALSRGPEAPVLSLERAVPAL